MPVYRHANLELSMPAHDYDCFTTGDSLTFSPRPVVTTVNVPPSGFYLVGTTSDGSYMKRGELPKQALIPDANQTTLLGEIATFWAAAKKYESLGFPHKRGLLLHGVPGCGKSTTMRLIASDIVHRGGYDLDLCGTAWHHALPLISAINQLSPDSTILGIIEDVDAICRSHEESLCNFLDGTKTINHLLIAATTNHPERLSPRIVRPSRFDWIIEVAPPNEGERTALIKAIAPDMDQAQVQEIVTACAGASVAVLKEAILQAVIYNKRVVRVDDKAIKFESRPQAQPEPLAVAVPAPDCIQDSDFVQATGAVIETEPA